VALFDRGTEVAFLEVSCAGREADNLLVKIDEMLVASGHVIADVTQVMVVRGPGLFTALRVGVMTANALAFALSVPLVSLTAFEYLASRIPLTKDVQMSISSGASEYFVARSSAPLDVEIVNEDDLEVGVVGECDLISLADAIAPFWDRDPQMVIEPLYIKQASIT